jgi:hypothetical protein
MFPMSYSFEDDRAPVGMEPGSRLASAKFALFSRFGATSWTTPRQRRFLF